MGAHQGVTNLTLLPAARLRGTIDVPGDKSISHRAVLLAALADGVSRVTHLAPGADQRSMTASLRALGVGIDADGGGVVIQGGGLLGLTTPVGLELDCGNSGATLRFLTGVLCAIPGTRAQLSGDESLRARPMERVATPLRRMGAEVETTAGRPPLTVAGRPLAGITHDLEVASAQVKTAILLAGLNADGVTSVVERIPTRDHTERLLSRLGVAIDRGEMIRMAPPGRLPGFELAVPGDPSAAAFWVVLAAIHPDAELVLRGVCINPTRSGYLAVLARMGAEIQVGHGRDEAGEPVADITVQSSRLRGTEVSAEEVPSLVDEVPVLAVAAAAAEGTTIFRGLAELRVKESDRVDAIRDQLGAMGARVDVDGDDIAVSGREFLDGSDVDAGGDHRVAMMLAVAATVARGVTRIRGAESAGVSYPGFYDQLAALGK